MKTKKQIHTKMLGEMPGTHKQRNARNWYKKTLTWAQMRTHKIRNNNKRKNVGEEQGKQDGDSSVAGYKQNNGATGMKQGQRQFKQSGEKR